MRFPKLAAFLLAACAAAPAAGPFFFVQMSDPQFGMQSKDHDFQQETATFEFAIATMNRLKPAFVVITGDLVNKPGDPGQTAEYLRICAKLDPAVKLYHVAGNHDVGNEPTPETLTAYRARFGPDYYAFRQGDFTGIVLDSALIQQPGKAPEEARKQEEWLRAELAGSKGRVVVFQHHPWFLEKMDEAAQYFNIPVETRRRYLDLFQTYGVKHVFAGHYHRNSGAQASGLDMVVTGPVGMPLGAEQSGMRIVIVRPDGLDHRYFPLGVLPNRVDPTTGFAAAAE